MSLPDLPSLSAQGRAAIDRAARQLAELVRQPLLPEEFFGRYLETVVKAVQGLGGAVWLRNEQGAHLYARENFSSSGYHASEKQKQAVDRLLGAVFQEKTAYILAARQEDGFATPHEGEIENDTRYPFFFFPIQLEDRVAGVACVWLAEAGEPKVYPEILRFLLSTAQQAGGFLASLQGNTVALRLSQTGNMVRCLEDLVGVVEGKTIAIHAVNRLQEFFRASRCTLFRRDRRGKWRLEMTSNQEAIDHRSQLVQHLCALAGAIPRQPEPLVFSRAQADEPLATGLDLLATQQAACVFFKRTPGPELDGLLLIERFAPTPFPAEIPHHLEWAGKQLHRAFAGAAVTEDAAIPVLSWVAREVRRGWRIRSSRMAAMVLVPLALLSLLVLMPWPLRIAGDCQVIPQRLASVTAEADGRLTQVLAREGDRVEADQVIARIDDRDLITQLAVARHEVQRWEASAYSSHQQGQEAQRGLAEINLARASVAIERLDYLKSKTEIRSPIAGVILSKNLTHREGETVQTGQLICEVADQEVYEVHVMVRQQDVGLVLRELETGQPLEIDFILHAYPHLRMTTTVHSVSSISQEATIREGVSYFVLRALFPVENELQGVLKPGYSGVAKVNLPHRPAGAVMFRRFSDFVRMRWTL